MSFRIRPLATVILAALSLAVFAGCAPPSDPGNPAQNYETTTVTVAVKSTGETVNCVVFDGRKAGGLVCDWENLGNAAQTPDSYTQGETKAYLQKIGERRVDCIIFDGIKAGGVSCNF
jgi:hypothetical protein